MSRAGRDNPSPFQPLRCRDITLLFLGREHPVRKLLAVLAVSAAALIPALLVAAPSLAAPASPLNASYGPYDIFSNAAPSLALHAHCDNCVMTIASAGFQDWAIVADTSADISGLYQIVLQGTHWCADFHATDFEFWLNPCDGTSAGQQFSFTGTGNPGQDWYVSRQCTRSENGQAGFLTALLASDGSAVVCQLQGQGDRAVWNNVDS